MAHSNGIITAPVSFNDVNAVLGASHTDLANLCNDAKINMFAKYKSVRHSKPSVLSDADFISAGYGLVMPSAFYANTKSPDTTWSYNKPRIGTDFSRLSDFNGYAHNAICPFGFDFSGSLGSSIGLWFYIDSSANIIYNDGKTWQGDKNLSVSDILTSKGYGNAYLGFCIHDLYYESSYTAVVTNKKLSELSSSVPTIILYAEQRTDSGLTYPAVPMLAEKSRDGHNFRVIAALFTSGPSAGYAYSVVTTNPQVYPLGFKAGCDKVEKVLGKTSYIGGLKATLSVGSVSWTYVGRDTSSGSTMDEYSLSCIIYGTFVTPSNWSVSGNVSVKVTIQNPYGYAGGSTYTTTGYVSIPNSSTTYSNRQICTISGLSVKWFDGVPSSVRCVNVAAIASYRGEDVAFDNSVEVKLS